MIIKMLQNIFEPKMNRNIYAVNHGAYKGDFLVYIKSDNENHNFLTLPYN